MFNRENIPETDPHFGLLIIFARSGLDLFFSSRENVTQFFGLKFGLVVAGGLAFFLLRAVSDLMGFSSSSSRFRL